jgi:hypothetical protein
MNGATAEPWPGTAKPPNSPILTKIGNSQNFLPALKKIQSSVGKLMIPS